MKIIVFGPAGGTGQQLVSQALAAGHDVTAFTRNPSAIAPRQRLAVIAGSTLESRGVELAMAGHDAVACALGGQPWRRQARVCSSAIRNIVPAMARHGVRRIVALSTFGAGNTRPHVGWLARSLLFGLVLRSEVADKEAMETELSATDLEWIVVRIGRLTDEPARGTWRAADDGSIQGMGKIARADVAAFMLGQLEANAWLRRKPVVMY
ncbi:MAG TPA: SDR family oxidoreductase [Burkholderiaceae bacterium]|nr:SDR family oxidoreductase [Burkholderiaceae bacterium]